MYLVSESQGRKGGVGWKVSPSGDPPLIPHAPSLKLLTFPPPLAASGTLWEVGETSMYMESFCLFWYKRERRFLHSSLKKKKKKTKQRLLGIDSYLCLRSSCNADFLSAFSESSVSVLPGVTSSFSQGWKTLLGVGDGIGAGSSTLAWSPGMCRVRTPSSGTGWAVECGAQEEGQNGVCLQFLLGGREIHSGLRLEDVEDHLFLVAQGFKWLCLSQTWGPWPVSRISALSICQKRCSWSPVQL